MKQLFLIGVAGLALVAGTRARALQDRPAPIFRSAVDLVAVDVQVVAGNGEPVDGLNLDDFEVFFNGQPRRIVSVDFIRKLPLPSPEDGGPERPIVTPGVVPPGARVFVLAIDSSSFSAATIKPAMQAAEAFLRQLQPDDIVGLYIYPFERPAVNFTHDHFSVQRALGRVVGQLEPFNGTFHLSPSEAIDIQADDGEILRRAVARECRGEDSACPESLHMEAIAQTGYYETQGMVGLRGVSLLLRGLATLPGRKTVVLLSGGLIDGNRPGSRSNLGGFMMTVGAEAGAAESNLYVVHLDTSFFDPFSASAASVRDPSARVRSAPRDEYMLGVGLERLAGVSGGTFLHVQAGTGAPALSRVLRESSAYYLLGVQPVSADRDGKLHFLRVKVKKRGVAVRSRTHVVIPRK